ncbi:hypothetical protein BJV77DRAFT_772111 [Russula vinacea]|nr:hypothetical protein BJV77DRAFT_772111 [Russula vinacea]
MFKTSSRTLGNRESSSTLSQRPSSSKRASVVSISWDFGCYGGPCTNRRKDSSCSECAENHRAKDGSQCLASLRARRGEGASDRRGASTFRCFVPEINRSYKGC